MNKGNRIIKPIDEEMISKILLDILILKKVKFGK
jgi:hypothetical protein